MRKQNFNLPPVARPRPGRLRVFGRLAIVLAGLGGLCGCESESADALDVRVSPAYVELQRGESVTLTASGWSNYRWRLSQPNLGTLSAGTGSTVVYTVRHSPSSTNLLEQTVFADAIVQTATNRVGGLTGSARIRHR